MPSPDKPTDTERLIAVVKATCAVCTNPNGQVDSSEAIVVLVGALTTFAGCAANPSDALLTAIGALEQARKVYANPPRARAVP